MVKDFDSLISEIKKMTEKAENEIMQTEKFNKFIQREISDINQFIKQLL